MRGDWHPASASSGRLGWSGLGSTARGRSRLRLDALWFFLRPGSGSAAGVGEVGPWWGRGWEDGVARLGSERLGLRSGVVSGGRPQLLRAFCGPSPAAAARTQVMTTAPGFSSLGPSALAVPPQGRRPCGPLVLPLAHPLSSPVPSSLRPPFFSLLSPVLASRHAPPARALGEPAQSHREGLDGKGN